MNLITFKNKYDAHVRVTMDVTVDSFEVVDQVRSDAASIFPDDVVCILPVTVVVENQTFENKCFTDIDKLIAKNCTFVRCNFNNVYMQSCSLRRCKFIECDFSESAWDDLDDVDAVVFDCDFKDCQLNTEALAVLGWSNGTVQWGRIGCNTWN